MAPTGKNVFRIQSRRVLSPRYSVRPAAISTALLLSQAFPKAMLFPAAFRCMAKAAEGRLPVTDTVPYLSVNARRSMYRVVTVRVMLPAAVPTQ